MLWLLLQQFEVEAPMTEDTLSTRDPEHARKFHESFQKINKSIRRLMQLSSLNFDIVKFRYDQ
jgi:hypothetical protein